MLDWKISFMLVENLGINDETSGGGSGKFASYASSSPFLYYDQTFERYLWHLGEDGKTSEFGCPLSIRVTCFSTSTSKTSRLQFVVLQYQPLPSTGSKYACGKGWSLVCSIVI